MNVLSDTTGPTTNCANCGDANASSKCSRCKSAHYCSRACQKKDWAAHKKDCKESTSPGGDGLDIKATVAEDTCITEVHNCAGLLAAANQIIGKEGPSYLDLDIKEDAVSARPGYVDNTMTDLNISKHILGVPIGQKGLPVTMDVIISTLRNISDKDVRNIEYSIDLLTWVKKAVGKKGPCYFEHGIVTHSNGDCNLDKLRVTMASRVVDPGTVGSVKVKAVGELMKVQIGKNGKKVKMSDIIAVFNEVSKNTELDKFRHSGRSYFHEGFRVSGNGKTLSMMWGS